VTVTACCVTSHKGTLIHISVFLSFLSSFAVSFSCIFYFTIFIHIKMQLISFYSIIYLLEKILKMKKNLSIFFYFQHFIILQIMAVMWSHFFRVMKFIDLFVQILSSDGYFLSFLYSKIPAICLHFFSIQCGIFS
jgi:hypothetical protein